MKPKETTRIINNKYNEIAIASEMTVQQIINDYITSEYEENEIFILDFSSYFVDFDDYPIFELCEIDQRQREQVAQMVIFDINRLTIII